MKALITGGNGFLGSTLARMLMEKNYQISIFDITNNNTILSETEKSRVTFFQGDLGNMAHVINAVKEFGPDSIFHVGSLLSVPSENNPQNAFRVNAEGSYNVFEAARIFEVKKVLYSSSMNVYGIDIKGEVVDDYTLQRPTTIYGVLKAFSENLGRYYAKKYGIDFRALRYASIVGPGSKTKHVTVHNSWMIEKSFYGQAFQIFVEPQTKNSIVYFKDAARAMVLLDEAPKESIKTMCYNLLGLRVSAQELAEKVREKIPQAQLSFQPEEEIMRIHRPLQKFTISDSKAREEWGWQPEYLLDQMVEDFVSVLKDNYDFFKPVF